MLKIYKAANQTSYPLHNEKGEFVQRISFDGVNNTFSTQDKNLIKLIDFNAEGCPYFKCIKEELDENVDVEDATKNLSEDSQVSESVIDGITTLAGIKEYLQYKLNIDPSRLSNKEKVKEVVTELGITFSGYIF